MDDPIAPRIAESERAIPRLGARADPARFRPDRNAAQQAGPSRPEVHFEVLALRGNRWELQQIAADEAKAMLIVHALKQHASTRGVRVVRERYDPQSRLSRGRIVYEKVKAGGKDGVRTAWR